MLLDKKKYKDQCDQCGAFAILKSFSGKCLCENCLKKETQNNSLKDNQNFKKKLIIEQQISIYDIGGN